MIELLIFLAYIGIGFLIAILLYCLEAWDTGYWDYWDDGAMACVVAMWPMMILFIPLMTVCVFIRKWRNKL